jgi:anti-sigma B factor antagonist
MLDDRIGGFSAEVIYREGAPVVVVRGEIDLSTAPALRAALDKAVNSSGRVEVDLRDTSFMDSCGLHILAAVHQRLGQPHDALVIRDPSPEVRLVLEVSGLAALFDVRTDSDGAGPDRDRS